MRALIASVSILLTIGCGATLPPVVAPEPLGRADFGASDHDQDDSLTQDEFLHATEPYAVGFDTDGDGKLDAVELAAGLFRAFDENGTGRVDEAELARGAMRWWPEEVSPRFDQWNTHPDRGLDAAELSAAMERLELVRRWDRDQDGKVSHPEVSTALFSSWDLDESASIDPLEWRWD